MLSGVELPKLVTLVCSRGSCFYLFENNKLNLMFVPGVESRYKVFCMAEISQSVHQKYIGNLLTVTVGSETACCHLLFAKNDLPPACCTAFRAEICCADSQR
jgi:hypothetical protein